jgi:ATP-binding cassette subfamily B protein
LFIRVAYRALTSGLSVGDLAIFGGATARLRVTVEGGIMAVSGAMQEALHVSDLLEFLRARPRIESGTGRILSSPRGDIEFRNVSFSYPGAAEKAVDGVSLRIQPGETVAVVGENGAGKTTMMKLMARLYDPDEGQILFDGVDMKELASEHLYNQIAFVFQSFGRYETTAGGNIAYGNWRRLLDDRAEVERVARLAGVHDMIAALPNGYDTPLGRMFGQFDLSGGEWQKVAVARAFARDAALLILDEPTSNLDAQAEYNLFCRFRELAHGRTTVLISHRFSTVSMADRILVMERGRIVEQGTHRELLGRAGSYARLYDLHQRQMASTPAADDAT